MATNAYKMLDELRRKMLKEGYHIYHVQVDMPECYIHVAQLNDDWYPHVAFMEVSESDKDPISGDWTYSVDVLNDSIHHALEQGMNCIVDYIEERFRRDKRAIVYAFSDKIEEVDRAEKADKEEKDAERGN